MTDRFEPLPFSELEEKIGYTFRDKSYLVTALTHSSYANESHQKNGVCCNERLEFLGDSVLSFIVSSYIYGVFPALDEGRLTRIRASVVCENALCEFAREIGIGDYMQMGHGEIVTHGRERKSVIADAFEALLAAIYLDGGIECARTFLMPKILPALEKANRNGDDDYKSRLQKIVQQTPEELLEYVPVSEEGPPHNRVFTFRVLLNSNLLGEGTGRSKREAEQNAAREALVLLGEIDEKDPS